MVEAKIRNLKSAIEYIHGLDQLDTPQLTHDYAFGHGIERARHLLTRLGGAPNATTKCVLVAGSKGKGSTVAMLSSVLSAAGYRVGVYTGPHLHTPLERFSLFSSATEGRGYNLMSEAKFVAFAERIEAIVDSWDRPELGLPTRIEAFTAMAYRWFEEQAMDIAVMEIGIGGRLDAVNLAEPIVSIITNISLEHTQILGKTLAEIAHAKAGILRPRGYGVIARQTDQVAQVICDEAESVGSRLLFANECCQLECVGVRIGESSDDSGQWFRIQYCDDCVSLFANKPVNGASGSTTLFLPLLGRYQLENAAAVITAIKALKERGYAISHDAMRAGFAAARWPGRFEVLRRVPTVIADGAHTPYSMQQLCASLHDYFPDRRIHFIIGTLRDKDSTGIVQAAMAVAKTLIFTGMDVRRATPASHLYGIWKSLSLSPAQSTSYPQANQQSVNAHVTVDLSTAMRQAWTLARPNDVICITGSLHLVAEAEELFKLHGASVE